MIASPALQHGRDVVDGLLGDLAGRDHHPDRARRRVSFAASSSSEDGARRRPRRQLRDRVGVDVVDDDVVAVAHQAPRHVRAHPAEPDHSELCHGRHPMPVHHVAGVAQADLAQAQQPSRGRPGDLRDHRRSGEEDDPEGSLGAYETALTKLRSTRCCLCGGADAQVLGRGFACRCGSSRSRGRRWSR